MLPYSAIDYAAYQTRSLIHPQEGGGSAFTHSWLVPGGQDLCGGNFKPQQPQQIIDPRHVSSFSATCYFIIIMMEQKSFYSHKNQLIDCEIKMTQMVNEWEK